VADIDDLLAAVAAGPQGPDVGAFFDFDGTLIHGYSAVLYFRQRMASRAVGPQELIGTLAEVFNMRQRGYWWCCVTVTSHRSTYGTTTKGCDEQRPCARQTVPLPRRRKATTN